MLQENPCRYDKIVSGGLLGGFNTYAYVGENPLSYGDPSGNNPAIIAGGVVGAIGGVTGALATGGNPWTGGIIGGVTGMAVGALGPAIGPAVVNGVVDFGVLAAQAATRAIASGVGNVAGQSLGDGAFNAGSLVGSALGGAVSGLLAPGTNGASFTGGYANQILERAIAGIPGSSASTVSSVVGTILGRDKDSGGICRR